MFNLNETKARAPHGAWIAVPQYVDSHKKEIKFKKHSKRRISKKLWHAPWAVAAGPSRHESVTVTEIMPSDL
jgi:hypothetical protein